MFIYSFSSVYLFISEADGLMPTSDDQQAQIAELRADVRVLEEKHATHITEVKLDLSRQKFWIVSSGGGLAILFLIASVGIIFNLVWS